MELAERPVEEEFGIVAAFLPEDGHRKRGRNHVITRFRQRTADGGIEQLLGFHIGRVIDGRHHKQRDRMLLIHSGIEAAAGLAWRHETAGRGCKHKEKKGQ